MKENNESGASSSKAYSCEGCGAPLMYKPGTSYLLCPYCGSKKEIEQTEIEVEELDFNTYIEKYEEENFSTTKVVECSNCKATPTVDENLKSMHCPYCGSGLVEKNVHVERYIKPGYVAPFLIDKNQVNTILEKWIKKRWFIPSKLLRAALSPVNLNGIYIPYWTFDAHTVTDYTGERGDAYYITVGSGKNRRQVRRVRWTSVWGQIRNFYDDVLVSGTKSLDRSLLSNLGGWDTHKIQKINDSYLAGFITEKYQVGLKDSFISARQIIENIEQNNVRYDIGGDEQRIHSMDVKLYDVTFKHVLLPVYVSAFRYKDKLYTFYVNGASGRISGERPYSTPKIVLAIIAGLALVITLYFLFS